MVAQHASPPRCFGFEAMSEFSGKVALVTGSSSGIGEAIARSLHSLGASVVINSSSSVDAGKKIAESLGENAIYVQADISDKDAYASSMTHSNTLANWIF